MSRDSIKNFVCRAGIEPALRVPQTLVLTIALTTPCKISKATRIPPSCYLLTIVVQTSFSFCRMASKPCISVIDSYYRCLVHMPKPCPPCCWTASLLFSRRETAINPYPSQSGMTWTTWIQRNRTSTSE